MSLQIFWQLFQKGRHNACIMHEFGHDPEMRKVLAIAFMLPPFALLYAACGGDDVAQQPQPDAAVETSLVDKAKILPDTSQGDTTQPNVCVPADTSAFKPNWVPPVHDVNACSDVQIQDYWSNCYDKTTASQPKCSAWVKVPANKACLGCLDTPDTALAYGTLIGHKGFTSANQPGCVAVLTNDVTANGCGAKIAASDECQHVACQACSDAISSADPQTFKDFLTCLTNAAKTVCKTYTQAVCADAGADLSACGPHSAFQDYYFGIAPVLCGGKAADGGVLDSGVPLDASLDVGPG